MKKVKFIVSSIVATVLLTACGSEVATSVEEKDKLEANDKIITVGASVVPHAEILEETRELLADKGYELNIVEYTDYVLPNTALDAGDLDANFFQHTPYLEEFNLKNDTDISSALSVHFEPLGIYSDKVEHIDEIPNGAKIAVPNDATNEARALLLLEANGIITLKEGVGVSATKLDIEENPYNVEIVEMEAAQLARVLTDVDLACINGNYALQGGLSATDAIATEASDSLSAQTYANILAVRTGQLDSEKTEILIEVLSHESVRDFIETNYGGTVISVF